MKVLTRGKWLSVLISIIFAMVLLAGCGNNNAADEIGDISIGGDESSTGAMDAKTHYKTFEMNDGWPAEGLPEGFPKYPGGDQYYEVDEYFVSVLILETDSNTFNDYMDSMKSFGFEFEPAPDEDGSYDARMGSWSLSLGFYEEWDAVIILVSDWGPDFVSGEWPAELPEYPDGSTFVNNMDTGSIWISVDNTSKASMEQYFDILINAGWEHSPASENRSWDTFEKGKLYLDITLKDDGTSLTLTLMEKTIFSDLPAEWPTEHLPAGFPEYPEGDVTSASLGDNGKVFVSISGSNQATMDAYKATLENAGWSFDEKTNTGYWYGKKDGTTVSLSVSDGGMASIFVS